MRLLLSADTGFAARQAALVRSHRKLYADWSRRRWGASGGYNALYNPGQVGGQRAANLQIWAGGLGWVETMCSAVQQIWAGGRGCVGLCV